MKPKAEHRPYVWALHIHDWKTYALTANLYLKEWDQERYQSYGPTDRGVEGLKIWATCYSDSVPLEWYAPQYGIQGMQDVQLIDAEAMVATLRRLDRGLAKAVERDGQCTTLGKLVFWLSKLLDVQEMLRYEDGASEHAGAYSLREMEWYLNELPARWARRQQSPLSA